MTEIVAPTLGEPARLLRREAKGLQDLLGEYQDAAVARPWLRDILSGRRGRTGATYRVLGALERAREERVLRELPSRVARLRDLRAVAGL